MDIHINQNDKGITWAIKRVLIEEGAKESDFNLSIWNEILNLVDKQNEKNLKEGKESLYKGDNRRDRSQWGNSYRVFAGDVLKFSEGIWNQIKAVVGIKPTVPEILKAEIPESNYSFKQEASLPNSINFSFPAQEIDGEVQASQKEKISSNPDKLPEPSKPDDKLQQTAQVETPITEPQEEALASAPLEKRASSATDKKPEALEPDDKLKQAVQAESTIIEQPEEALASAPQEKRASSAPDKKPESLKPDDKLKQAVQAESTIIEQPEEALASAQLGKRHSSAADKKPEALKPDYKLKLTSQAEIKMPEQGDYGADLNSVKSSSNTETSAVNTIPASGAIIKEDGSIVLDDMVYYVDKNGVEVVKTKYSTFTSNSKNRFEVETMQDLRAKIFGYKLADSVNNVYYNEQDGYVVWDDKAKKYIPYQKPAKPVEVYSYTPEFKNSKADGAIGKFSQYSQADCWLLSSLKALNSNSTGKALLKECINADSAGNVTVNLKGLDKSYKISADEINKAIEEGTSAAGDKDVAAVELAFQKYIQEEVVDKNQYSSNYNSLNHRSGTQKSEYLYGGRPKVAIEALTGKKVSTISRTQNEDIIVRDDTVVLGKMDEESLKPFMDNKNNIIIVSIKDGDMLRKGQSHGVYFKGYDDEFVYLEDTYLNPDGSDKIIKMKKEDFYSNLLEFSYTELNTPMDKAAAAPEKRSPIIRSKEVDEYLKKQNEQ